MINVEPVGWVRTSRRDLSDDFWGGITSTIELDTSRFEANAVAGLDQFSHIEVIYYFDKVSLDKIVTGAGHPRENPAWPKVGIFAQRKKNRPNRLGLTTCRLLKIEATKLTVTGLDAIDGTPVLDIKPCVREFMVDKEDVSQPEWIGELMKDYFAAKK